jgi:hypothetical protein
MPLPSPSVSGLDAPPSRSDTPTYPSSSGGPAALCGKRLLLALSVVGDTTWGEAVGERDAGAVGGGENHQCGVNDLGITRDDNLYLVRMPLPLDQIPLPIPLHQVVLLLYVPLPLLLH